MHPNTILVFKRILWLALVFLGLVVKLYWLVILFLWCSLCYVIVQYGLHKIAHERIRKTLSLLAVSLFVFILSIGIKMFVVEIFKIPSDSMKNALMPDDVILVNKLAYGPKLPGGVDEILWLNLIVHALDYPRKDKKVRNWPYRRLAGYQSIRRGDILVYEPDRTYFMVKRCVAISGDTLKIEDGGIRINGEKIKDPETVLKSYKITLENRKGFYAQLDSIDQDIELVHNPNSANDLWVNLTHNQKRTLDRLDGVNLLKRKDTTTNAEVKLFANTGSNSWTSDTMGPFVIPEKGLKIKLDSYTYPLYKNTLINYEGVFIMEDANGFFDKDGNQITSYVFRHNYFFLMGDNRDASLDSRFFGFIPEAQIVGKVQHIL